MSKSPVYKKDLSRSQRLFRLIWAALDPRVWAHLAKLLNYYNYTNVSEVRKISLGKGVRISPTASFANAQNITLGDGARIGAGACLWAGPGKGQIVLGKNTLIAPNVMLTAANYAFNKGSPVNDQPMEEEDILVGSDVWLGYGAVVLAGTRIGDGAIIGAGAVVRGTVPEGAVIAAPAPQRIGRRTGYGIEPEPPVATSPATHTTDLLGLVTREIPKLRTEDLGRPLDTLGVDSFDLISLRTAIEASTNIQIPDAEWSSIKTLQQIAALPALQTRDSLTQTTQIQRKTGAQETEAASTTSENSTTEAGKIHRNYTINMPQMALSGLSESWLFKELGDLHWEMITRFLQTPSSGIVDEHGDRLYATFTRIALGANPNLRAFEENAEMLIRAHLERFGSRFFFGHHKVRSSGASCWATTMSTFAKYGEKGRNTSLMKGTPTLPDPSAIPSLESFPDFGSNYRERRNAVPGEVLFECRYDILAPHDINGVGLLYFAAYPTIFDLCIERAECKHFLAGHSTTHKDICYFANAEPTEALVFRLHERTETNGMIRHVSSLYRESDDVRMAELISTRTPV